MHSSPRRLRRQPVRRGFTLIELLIVLAILAMLAGLLLAAVGRGSSAAHVTATVAELSNLEKAIQDFKLKFGMEPPSFMLIYEDGPNWGTSLAARRSRAVMMKMWPDYDFAQRDINNDGDDTDVITLQGPECLLFFLGGNGVLYGMNRQAQGFSANPANPFVAGGQRIGPFHEFNTARFVDIDGDGNPEYLDPIPNQLLPILYFSSYDGSGYRPYGVDGTPGNADDEIIEQSGTDVINSIYMVQDDNWAMNMSRPSAMATNFHKPRSFQLISPGLDFQFGSGGTWVSGRGLAVKNDGMDNYRDITLRRAEFDNITNFSSGQLGELTVVVP